MAGTSVFEDLRTFEQWDSDYYPALAAPYYDRAIRQVLRSLGASPDDLVLDAGCGPGEHSIRIAREGCRVYAVDISAAVLEEARCRAQVAGVSDRIRFERKDLTCLDLESESFDRVFSWGVVIHIPDAERALCELVRILKPGGKLALYITNDRAWDYTLVAAARFLRRRPQPRYESHRLGAGCWYNVQDDRLWVWRFSIKAVKLYLESLGLRQTDRLPGSLTDIQRRLRGRLRNSLLVLNDYWHRLNCPPGPCATNLLVFDKRC